MHAIAPAHPVFPALFDTPYLHFVVTAMGAGNSPALAWADDLHEPTSALIWDKSHCLYFGGDAYNEPFIETLSGFLSDSLIPEARQQQLGLLKLYFANENWHTTIASLLPDVTVQDRARVLYRLPSWVEPRQSPNLPAPMQLRLIDDELLQNKTLTGIRALTEEIESCWTSLEHFVDQAFGYCIVDERAGIVSWCTAEYVSPGICGVGIETLQAYQRRGLASITANAFAQRATRLGWQVNWDSWLSNTASIRVAEKVGFEKITDYQISAAKLA